MKNHLREEAMNSYVAGHRAIRSPAARLLLLSVSALAMTIPVAGAARAASLTSIDYFT